MLRPEQWFPQLICKYLVVYIWDQFHWRIDGKTFPHFYRWRARHFDQRFSNLLNHSQHFRITFHDRMCDGLVEFLKKNASLRFLHIWSCWPVMKLNLDGQQRNSMWKSAILLQTTCIVPVCLWMHVCNVWSIHRIGIYVYTCSLFSIVQQLHRCNSLWSIYDA